MATNRMFLPPLLKDVNDIDNWLREIELWQCITTLEPEKQAPAIYLSLDDKIRNTCTDIQVRNLNSADGVNILIQKLKALFAKDAHQAAYSAYEEFENFKFLIIYV